MKKTINGRKLEHKKYEGEGSGGVYSSKLSGSHLGLSQGQDKSGKSEYFQVEISSNRHSGGSDKYSVVNDLKVDEHEDSSDDEDDEADDNSYAIIDMTDPIPRCVNYPGPDIIQDLPSGSGPRATKKVVRSSSFVSSRPGELFFFLNI